jgi:DNA-binding NtrC family response regulator
MTIALPKLLVIDDQLGDPKNPDRQRFCETLRLRDPERPEANSAGHAFLAEAYFCRGQHEKGGVWRNNLATALKSVARLWPDKEDKDATQPERWAMILVDYRFVPWAASAGSMPISDGTEREFGAQIIQAITEKYPFVPNWENERAYGPCQIPILSFSSASQQQVEQNADPAGSLGFFPKWRSDESAAKIRADFAALLSYYGLVEDGALRRVAADGTVKKIDRKDNELICGQSLVILRLLQFARRQVMLKTSDDPEKDRSARVLILGPKGTGKTKIAQYMHDIGAVDRPGTSMRRFVADSVPDNLLARELFGSVKHAFTDAADAKGVIEAAGRGSVLIDEVGNLPPDSLRKLLSISGDQMFSRIGAATSELRVQCHLFFATTRNVADMMKQGVFPEDLYDRMSGVLHLPPLEICGKSVKEELFRNFIEKNCPGKPLAIPPDVIELVRNRPWKGNVREVEATVTRIVSRRRASSVIQSYDFKQEIEDAPSAALRVKNLQELVEMMEEFQFSDVDAETKGIFPRFQLACARLVELIIDHAAELDKMKGNEGNKLGANLQRLVSHLGMQEAKSTSVAIRTIAYLDRFFQYLPTAPNGKPPASELISRARQRVQDEQAPAKRKKATPAGQNDSPDHDPDELTDDETK